MLLRSTAMVPYMNGAAAVRRRAHRSNSLFIISLEHRGRTHYPLFRKCEQAFEYRIHLCSLQCSCLLPDITSLHNTGLYVEGRNLKKKKKKRRKQLCMTVINSPKGKAQP